MKNWRFILVLLLLPALAACGSSAVFMDYNMAGLWSNYHTYNLMTLPRPEDIGSLATNPKNRTTIADAIDFNLKNRGLLLDAENPEMLVAYYAGKKDTIDPKVWGYTYSPPGSYKDQQGPPDSFKSNTLVIDLVDAKSKELMWRGWSAGVIDAPNNEKVENSIREVVKKILAEYPPH